MSKISHFDYRIHLQIHHPFYEPFFLTVARYLNVLIISGLIAILTISQTNAVCCNDPAFDVQHTCSNMPGEYRSDLKVMFSYWFVKSEPDWADLDLEKSICYTQFCADGSVKTKNCGSGCGLFGCFCDRCYENQGATFDDMEKAWAKKNGFTKFCSGWHEKCDEI